ncbi:MAG: M36 family metallopeptidase, partial [Acidobacteriota bacterium]
MKQQRDPQYLRCTPAGRLAVLTALLALLVSGSAWAAAPGSHHQHNHRNYDARGVENLTFKAAPNFEQKQAIDALRADVPGLAVTFDKTLGVTRSLYNTTGYLTEPSLEKAAPLAVGLGYVRSQLSTLGLTEADLAEFEVTDSVYSKLSGATHIYLRQTYQGIPVYNGQLHLNINRDGRVISINNAFVPNLGSALKSLAPSIGADEAVAAAGLHLEIPLKSMPAILAADAGPRQATRVAAKGLSLEEVNAELMWLPIRSGDVRLVWNFQIQTTDYDHWFDMTVDAETGKVWTRFDWVNSGDFRVYAEPDESPLHGSVGRTLVTDPEDATASPNGWFTGGTMSGNNVTACPDTSPANNSCDSNPQCSGTTCDFPVDLSQQPSSYVPAATANLFYWNNLIHDIQYQYGFDEAGGNFQENNFGNGGAGGDSVNADAQDGSGNCNANFATPTDGGNPRMQMFTCTNASPARDGDFDNGVIVHEYGHGISIRQVGGPGNSSCLNNTQQAGEGWSDLLGLIYTHEPGDAGTDSRGIGTYLFGQAPDGPGIRDLPYSTDPAVNNWTYESISGASIP